MKKRETLEPLEAIKRLLILQLLKNGATKEEIGKALGVSYKTIERMFPTIRSKELKK